jgi:hypothetical protein
VSRDNLGSRPPYVQAQSIVLASTLVAFKTGKMVGILSVVVAV